MQGTAIGTFTNTQGRFTFSGIPESYCGQTMTILVSVIGYYGTNVQFVLGCDGITQTVDIWLTTGSDALVVTNTEDSGPGSLRQAILELHTL